MFLNKFLTKDLPGEICFVARTTQYVSAGIAPPVQAIDIAGVPAAAVTVIVAGPVTESGNGGKANGDIPTSARFAFNLTYKFKPLGDFRSPKISVLSKLVTALFQAEIAEAVRPRQA